MGKFITLATFVVLSATSFARAQSFYLPEVVEFRIAAGTGSMPWNTMQNPVQVKVGQVLRIINGDSVMHQLHTFGAPCPHGNAFGPGQYWDCAITKVADPVNTVLYDHNFGSKSRFYVNAIQ